ncbi:hypothetical protein KEM52_003583, partial [Ascosphaera acerosa]
MPGLLRRDPVLPVQQPVQERAAGPRGAGDAVRAAGAVRGPGAGAQIHTSPLPLPPPPPPQPAQQPVKLALEDRISFARPRPSELEAGDPPAQRGGPASAPATAHGHAHARAHEQEQKLKSKARSKARSKADPASAAPEARHLDKVPSAGPAGALARPLASEKTPRPQTGDVAADKDAVSAQNDPTTTITDAAAAVGATPAEPHAKQRVQSAKSTTDADVASQSREKESAASLAAQQDSLEEVQPVHARSLEDVPMTRTTIGQAVGTDKNEEAESQPTAAASQPALAGDSNAEPASQESFSVADQLDAALTVLQSPPEESDSEAALDEEDFKQREAKFEKEMKALEAELPPPILEHEQIVLLLHRIQLLNALAARLAAPSVPVTAPAPPLVDAEGDVDKMDMDELDQTQATEDISPGLARESGETQVLLGTILAA